MALHRTLDALAPDVAAKAQAALDELDATGAEYYVAETLRELSTQMAYYSRARMKVEDVQAMYKAAGLYAISATEAVKPCTWTLDSRHLKGRALDVYPAKDGKPLYNASISSFRALSEVFKKHGFAWGGDWKQVDSPHYEIA